MVKIEKIYMTSCIPCKEVSEILEDIKKTKEFELISYNIEDGDFKKERKVGKKLLAKWSATKVPLLIFSVNGETKSVLYGGIQQLSKELIEYTLESLNKEPVDEAEPEEKTEN